ncbi:MAG: lytic murein transglycosylase [Stellaceae bacterium]
MISRRTFALAFGSLLAAGRAHAADGDFSQWLKGVRADALAKGIRPATLDRALAGVSPIPRVIELDRNQPETTLTFTQYVERVVTPQRREDARAHYRTNRPILDQVEQRFGVEPRFIVALWGIETDFGRRTGTFKIIPALATLAFDGRRPAFFRGELLDALTIVDRDGIDPSRMLGSWAGAMGQSQFMPSSFLAFAVSFRGEGAPDIWNRRADVFASIANYLAHAGWRAHEGWGLEVVLPAQFASPSDEERSLADWVRLGITRVDGKPLAPRSEKASLVLPDGPGGPAFLAYDNFRALLKWNSSNYFAIAVGFLADSIGRG